MNTVSQAKLFEHQTVQDYIRNCQPKPAAFAHLEKRWNNPEIPRPPLSLNTICYDHDWASLFTEGRQDVDSLEIKSFCLTDSSITDALTTFVPRQLDVGTAWSSVKAPPRYYTLCGPRPTIMVYVGIFKGMNALDIRNAYAGYLTTKTGRFFHPTVNDGSCMFNTVKGSIDTIILMNEWLKLVTWLHSDVCTPDSEEELEIEKMKLMHIIYHGWKSHPDQIQNGFTTENLFDNCRKQNLTSFDTSFDLAQQYIANSSDVLTDANCTSIIRIPVFGFADEMVIPGFRQTKSVQKKSTFGMFGPIPGESKMGSIMMERSDADASIFPKNVSRVKIYPSVVNFIKQALAPPQVLKRRLTNQQLNTFANNVCDKYLSKLSSPTCRHYKNILMSFRIECTMHLDEENYCLDKVKLQFQEMTKDILKKLQQKIRVTMIAVEDISNIATFCLGRYYKMCLGNGSTLFRDQKMARAMVLSLWHIVGYHCHKATTDEHKHYLINVDMDDFETVAEAPIKILKSRGKQQNTCRNWSQTPMEAIQLVIGALKFMNLYEKKKNDSGTQWYYMYRKVCDIVVGQDTCPWCYSSATRLKKAAKSWTQQDKFGKHSLIACKSNHFSTLEELATDVYRRIEHHKRDTLNVKDLIESIFLPVQGRNKEIHAKILENILKILRPKDAASKEHPTIHAHSDHDAGPMSEVINIDDQPDDTGLNSILNLQQALDEIGEDQGTHQKKQAILRQDHVLARYSSSSMWREALVHDCNDTGYRIEFWGEQELHQVSEDNIKHFDWDYCRTKMQSWRYNDFRDTITDRGMQVAEQVYERGLIALQNLCVGTVVADHTAFTSYDGGGRAGTGEQCNCEILWVNCPDLNQSQSSPREDNKVGFVVTTKRIQQGENLKWLCKLQGQEKEDTNRENETTIHDEHLTDKVSSLGLNSETKLPESQVKVVEIGEDQGTHQKKQAILRQDHVLARYSSSSMWREALVHDCNDTGYRIEFWGEQELHQVSEDNIKHFDWDYCRTKMQSWRYNDFRDTITDRGMQVAEQVYERGLIALQNLCVGTVVADHTAFTSYDGGGRAGTGEQCNCEILWVNCPDLNQSQSSPREDNKVGFVVTTKRIQQGENLKWLCKLQGQEKEPNIMQSILFSMQGDVNEGREPFDLCAYMTLWRLQMPFPKKKHITISKTPYETTNFGSSIRPFLHQATIDLLLMNDVTNWLDIDANNSFIIHLAVAINKNPLALHTMFARNCAKKLQAKQDRVWTPDVLSTVMPSSISFKIMILEKQPDNDAYTCKVYGSTTHDAGQALESSVVLVRYGKDYTWLKDTKIQDVNIEKMVPDCHYFDCVKWETMTEKRVFIEGCHNSTREAPADWKENAWNTACEKVGLTKSESGKWLTKPPGFERDLRLQDGSLTPKSFDLLLQRLQQKKVTCKSIVDLGSEAGHAVAQFAFKPFVNKVIGIEIQYSWVAYSAIMIQHLQLESFKQNYYLADIQIIHGSFLDTKLSEWEAALSCADFCFCNNFNWDKGSVTVPRGQQALSGELKNNTNANVAHLLVDKMKLSSHVLVFDKTSFTSQEYQHVQSLDLTASWSTMGTTKVQILQMFPTHFNVLKKALQALCKAKLCSFESIPQEWWEHEVKENGKGFLRLIDHVLKQDHFNKSNSSVHLGWSVSPPMIVCIKKFPDNMQHVHIQREIDILKRIAQNSDTSTHNVIKFLGTDADRRGHTVLIFEMVDACSFESDLQTMTVQQIAQYMYMLLQALKYMHEHDIVHRDVKHQNFLHNFEKKTFRLIDFGSAVQGTQGFVRKGGGTRGFRAPETLIGIEKQTAAVDVWGAGIILLSLITGKLNILSRQDNKIRGDVCDATHLKEIGCIVGNSEMRQLHGEQSDEYGDGTQHENRTGWAAKALQSVIPGRYWKNDDHALDLLSKMLKVQPSKRITPEDALNHPFLQLAVKRP